MKFAQRYYLLSEDKFQHATKNKTDDFNPEEGRLKERSIKAHEELVDSFKTKSDLGSIKQQNIKLSNFLLENQRYQNSDKLTQILNAITSSFPSNRIEQTTPTVLNNKAESSEGGASTSIQNENVVTKPKLKKERGRAPYKTFRRSPIGTRRHESVSRQRKFYFDDEKKV